MEGFEPDPSNLHISLRPHEPFAGANFLGGMLARVLPYVFVPVKEFVNEFVTRLFLMG